ncbi:hypothetical protein MTR67_040001 [Solanum verrucosum]|uniref:Uncharacterized protein n=1 Tax=Solanum verrucosum TaxID=315347 RepID=A0AAF0UJL3_SOLVR|nr:hypothetical protein MTR67_040001 [Solanum verrucosum]
MMGLFENLTHEGCDKDGLLVLSLYFRKAVNPPNYPKEGSPSQAISELVVKSTARGKARGVACTLWGLVSSSIATRQGTTGHGSFDNA